MAPSLPSCIGNAFCSHRQASCFLLAILIPFFFPVLILCVPFLLLFLAPLSFFLLSLLLLHKVQALIKPKHSRILDKGAVLRQPGFAEENLLEEDKERRRYEDVPESEGVYGDNVQRLATFEGRDAEVLHATSSFGSESTGEEHLDVKEVGSESMGEELDDVKEAQARHVLASPITERESEELVGGNVQRVAAFEGRDAEVLHATSSFGSASTGEEHVDVKEVGSESVGEKLDDVKEAQARHEKWDERQVEGNVTEGLVENREEGSSIPHIDKVEDEGSQVLASPSIESSIAFTKEEQDDMMEGTSPKHEGKAMEVQEEDLNLEGTGGNFQDEHSMSSSYDGRGEESLMHFPSTHDQRSSYSQPEETFLEEHAADPRKVVPTVQSGVHVSINEFDERPSKDGGDKIFETAPLRGHEQGSSQFQPEGTPGVRSESTGDEHDDVKEAHASREWDKKQGEGNVIEGMVENSEEGLSIPHRDKVQDEGLHVVTSPSTESSIPLTKKEQDDMMDGISPKQGGKVMEAQEEDVNLEGTRGDFRDEHSMSSSFHGPGEGISPHLPFTHEQGSLYSQPEETLSEEQGVAFEKDLPTVESGAHSSIHLPFTHEQGSSFSQSEGALSEKQGIAPGKDLPTVESGVYGSIDEGPSKDGGDESFEIDPLHIHEQGSSHVQQGETPREEQDNDLKKDSTTGESGVQGWTTEFDEVPSKDGGDDVDPHYIHEHGSPHFQPEEIPPEEQGIGLGKVLPTGEGSMNEFEEGSSKDGGDEIFDIGTRHTAHLGTQEHKGEEPGLFFEKPSGSGSLDLKLGKPEEQELLSSMEKEVEEGEPSSTVTDSSEPWRADAFAKELQEDAQLQQGRPTSDLGVRTKSEFPEGDRPSKTSSSLEPSTQGPLEGVGSQQEKMQEKHRILSDIHAIKKIIGYQGEDHASLMEQITALYLFLGMEPYEWDVGVDDLEKARAEVELLKVVVGVK